MAANDTPQGWWMYQNGPGHGGYVPSTVITPQNAPQLQTLHTLQLGGPILSVPAVTNGYAYVGLSNSKAAYGALGGTFCKVSLADGTVAATYTWDIPIGERDTHGFTGMGCTPAVANGYVYFSAFNGKFYCLNEADLSVAWITDLRYADPVQNQPVTNDMGGEDAPPAAGWSSPLVANGDVYVGMGEGENPALFGFVYCLDGTTGKVKWIFCTSQFDPPQYDPDGNVTHAGTPNQPNQIPQSVVRGTVLPGFTAMDDTNAVRGGSVWSCIAYDADLNRLYLSTGNPQNGVDKGLPTAGGKGPVFPQPYTYAVISLDATTGALVNVYAPTQDTSYRPNDMDVDFGGSPILYVQEGQKRVAVANKNGTLFVLDENLGFVAQRQLLPYDVNGAQIPTVDPHPANQGLAPPTPSNEESNAPANAGENYSGPFGAPAVDPVNGRLFVGLGGPNYHAASPGLDYESTPFMRALDWTPNSKNTLDDPSVANAANWPMANYTFPTTQGNVTVSRYAGSNPAPDPPALGLAGDQMFQNPGEGSVGSPMVVNGVVFVATQNISLYAFDSVTGAALWKDDLGQQTLGLNGGYGYCMGPASDGTYVVAGALINGRDGGVLRIYGFPPSSGSGTASGTGTASTTGTA
ncbi:PQQ-binding-like beta-propeller repeat protein [Longimicrobium sp.]|uniref:outer membrane protein assembly factor BamB family protein n=1 Tax=Longimicrobium sp. TaxID=2029185 RepID=UPI002E3073DA|nr:PQQ-binding-like beta-propeller repeat protein [Longimicrobium sp.]HEX6038788.1 PQQ-binding-like beta-propeller repeat protein [Longimicrobium sp.]